MKEKKTISEKPIGKAKVRTKRERPTFLGVPILTPHFKPTGTTVKKIRAAVRAVNSQAR